MRNLGLQFAKRGLANRALSAQEGSGALLQIADLRGESRFSRLSACSRWCRRNRRSSTTGRRRQGGHIARTPRAYSIETGAGVGIAAPILPISSDPCSEMRARLPCPTETLACWVRSRLASSRSHSASSESCLRTALSEAILSPSSEGHSGWVKSFIGRTKCDIFPLIVLLVTGSESVISRS